MEVKVLQYINELQGSSSKEVQDLVDEVVLFDSLSIEMNFEAMMSTGLSEDELVFVYKYVFKSDIDSFVCWLTKLQLGLIHACMFMEAYAEENLKRHFTIYDSICQRFKDSLN